MPEDQVQFVAQNQVRRDDDNMIDVAVATAMRYPRNVTKIVNDCIEIVTRDKKIAESCMFTLPKSVKITGPSVYLARIFLQNWGNIRVRARVISTELKTISAEGTCWDLEKNSVAGITVQRSIFGKNGRYGDDMIITTGNAAIAIALRNCIFSIIPQNIIDKVYQAARKTITGDISDEQKLIVRRNAILSGFEDKYGVTSSEVLSYLGKKEIHHIKAEEIVILIGVANGIESGDLSVNETFRPKTELKTSNGDKAEERVLLLISDSKDIITLEKYKELLTTVERKSAYDKKFLELKKSKDGKGTK